MRILTLLMLLTLTVASCAKKEQAPKVDEAQSEVTSFGATPAVTSPKPAPKKKMKVPQPAKLAAPTAGSADEGAPLEVTGTKGARRRPAPPSCDAGCKKTCAEFAGVQSACEKAYIAGCFEKPRDVSDDKCRVPSQEDDVKPGIAADRDDSFGKAEKSGGDGAALPKLFGDP